MGSISNSALLYVFTLKLDLLCLMRLSSRKIGIGLHSGQKHSGTYWVPKGLVLHLVALRSPQG